MHYYNDDDNDVNDDNDDVNLEVSFCRDYVRNVNFGLELSETMEVRKGGVPKDLYISINISSNYDNKNL